MTTYPSRLQTPVIIVCCFAYAIEPLTIMAVAKVLSLYPDDEQFANIEAIELHLSPAQAYQLGVDTDRLGRIVIEKDFPNSWVEIWKDGVPRLRFESIAVPMIFAEYDFEADEVKAKAIHDARGTNA
jgi:hypothetical protein